MKIQYRTAYRGNGEWYPQVRFGWWIFWFVWQKIYRFDNGFLLHYGNSWNYPKTKQEAEQIIKEYDVWFKNEKVRSVMYRKFYP